MRIRKQIYFKTLNTGLQGQRTRQFSDLTLPKFGYFPNIIIMDYMVFLR